MFILCIRAYIKLKGQYNVDICTVCILFKLILHYSNLTCYISSGGIISQKRKEEHDCYPEEDTPKLLHGFSWVRLTHKLWQNGDEGCKVTLL